MTELTMDEWRERDRRENPRARMRLRLAIVYPQREGKAAEPVYHGVTHDICMSGLSLLAEENVYREGRLTVLLALPPVHNWASQRIIEVNVEMTYAIRSSKLNAYKIGVSFLEFKDGGRELLDAALGRFLRAGEADDSCSSSLGATDFRPTDSHPLGV